MQNYNIIKSVLSEPWAISELSLDSLFPLVANLFDSRLAFEKGEMLLPESRSFGGDSANSHLGRSYNVSVITVKGAMTKDDQFCGPAGMATMTQWVKDATADASIDAIMLKEETPGGTVVGTQEFGDAIAEARKVKPVISFVEDLCCSGGYWLASQCDEIIANNKHAQIGSIGVMMSFADAQPYYEKMGVKFHTIRASQSTDKNTTSDDLRAGKYEKYRKEVLDPLAENFIGIVKDARPGIKDSQLTGDVYFAHSVVGSLIDSIGNFDYALERAAALCEERNPISGKENATENQPSITENVEQNQIEMKKTINKVAGVDIPKIAEGNYVLSAEQAEKIELALATAETHAATIATHENTISGHIATIAAQATKITVLEAAPGAETAVAIKQTNKVSPENNAEENVLGTYSDVKSFFDKL